MSSSAAMQVLDDYAEMLGVLSSSQFTDDLQNKTVSLGASIDNSIATFNKGSGSNLNSFGDIVAGIVRAGGGIWIRHKQERALSAAVTHAEAPVGKLTEAVEALMQAYLTPTPNDPNSSNLFESEATELRDVPPAARRSWMGHRNARSNASVLGAVSRWRGARPILRVGRQEVSRGTRSVGARDHRRPCGPCHSHRGDSSAG